MNSGALLLDSKNQPLEAYPQELVELLAEGALSPNARRELDSLHRKRKRVKCADGIIRHAVQRAYPFLRVNPGQERVERGGCALCANSSANATGRGTFEIPESCGSIGATLATRLHPAAGADKGKPPKGRGGGVSRSRKYHKAFAVLWTILEQAGFTSLAGPLEWAEVWAVTLPIRLPLSEA